MITPTFDLTPFLGRHEGQHFDRKSMFEGEEGKKRPRDRRKVRDQVAGFANAEGGVLILGIELIVFDVPNRDVPVRVEGHGYPLRIGGKTVQVSESHIQRLKFRGHFSGDFRGDRVHQAFETVLPGPCVAEGVTPHVTAAQRHRLTEELGQRVKQVGERRG